MATLAVDTSDIEPPFESDEAKGIRLQRLFDEEMGR